MQSRSARGAGA